jgi:hypothetical protein
MWSPELNGERDAVTDHCAGNCSMGHHAELRANLTVQDMLSIWARTLWRARHASLRLGNACGRIFPV